LLEKAGASPSGKPQEGERKRTADEASKTSTDVVETKGSTLPWEQAYREPGYWMGDDRCRGGAILMAGSYTERGNLCRDAKGEPESGSTAEGRVPMHGAGADGFAVVMKPGNAGGAKGPDHLANDNSQPAMGMN
jgi:hypothetical protein